MKRIILLLFVLILAFPVCSAYAAEYTFSIVEKDRIQYTLPSGLSAEVTRNNGMLDILIDAEATDWGLVLAGSLTDWNTLAFPVSALAPESGCQQQNLNVRNAAYSDSSHDLSDVLSKLNQIAGTAFDPSSFSDVPYANPWDFAGYDEQSETVIPTVYADNRYCAHLVCWKNSSGDVFCEYYLISVRFSDDSARVVQLKSVPENRLIPDKRTDTAVSDGYIAYSIPSDSPFKGKTLTSSILAPDNAKGCILSFDGQTTSMLQTETLDGGKSGVRISHDVSEEDSLSDIGYSVFWYASDNDSSTPISVEHLSIQITIGTPQPFPRYISELHAIPSSRMLPVILNHDSPAAPSFISASYAAESDSYDTLFKQADPDAIPAGADLTGYSNKLYAAAPEGAIAYSVAFRTRSNIYGAMQQYYADSFVPALIDPQNRRTDFETISGKRAALLYQAPLFVTRTFSHDPSLTLYTSRDDADPATGRVIMVYWYDSLQKDAEPIAKEYLIDRVKPLSITTASPAYESESDISGAVRIPVVVTGKGIGARRLFLVTEKPVYTGRDCMLYGLHLADASGKKVVIGKEVTVILPYPHANHHRMRFSINHYNEKYEYVETYSEDNGLLVRTPAGLAFMTDSFSPFVLNWKEAPSTAVLPQTGDHSAPVFLLAAALLGSMLALGILKRKQA